MLRYAILFFLILSGIITYSQTFTANNAAAKLANITEQNAANATRPRNGKYWMLSYGANPANPLRLGYFVLSDNSYDYYDMGNHLLGSGSYTYDADKQIITWISGPFKTSGYSGGFEIDRNGKTHKIRLKYSTIGSNSID